MNRVQKKFLDEIVDAAEMGVIKLSEWEDEFIESLKDRPADYELSSKQNDVLNRLSQRPMRED